MRLLVDLDVYYVYSLARVISYTNFISQKQIQ